MLLSVCLFFSPSPPPPSVPSLSPIRMHHCIICFFVYAFIYSRCLIIQQVIYLISSFGGEGRSREEGGEEIEKEIGGVGEQKDEEGEEGEKQGKQDKEKEGEKKILEKEKRRGRSRKRKSFLLALLYTDNLVASKSTTLYRCQVNDFKQFCFPSL